jgi:hypothetical protein
VIGIYQIRDVEKILAEDGYEIRINKNTLFPVIYKHRCTKMVPFIMSDLLNKSEDVAAAAVYLKNLYDKA